MASAIRAVLFSALVLILPVAHAYATPPIVELSLSPDGSVQLNGQRVVGDAAIEAKFKELAKRNPGAYIHMSVSKTTRYATVAKVLALLQRSGADLKLGIVNTNQYVQ